MASATRKGDVGDFPLAGRGVYAESFTRGCMRGYYAVDSNGEQVAYRTVAQGKDPSVAIADLWAELNELDPVPDSSPRPSLTVMR